MLMRKFPREYLCADGSWSAWMGEGLEFASRGEAVNARNRLIARGVPVKGLMVVPWPALRYESESLGYQLAEACWSARRVVDGWEILTEVVLQWDRGRDLELQWRLVASRRESGSLALVVASWIAGRATVEQLLAVLSVGDRLDLATGEIRRQ